MQIWAEFDGKYYIEKGDAATTKTTYILSDVTVAHTRVDVTQEMCGLKRDVQICGYVPTETRTVTADR